MGETQHGKQPSLELHKHVELERGRKTSCQPINSHFSKVSLQGGLMGGVHDHALAYCNLPWFCSLMDPLV